MQVMTEKEDTSNLAEKLTRMEVEHRDLDDAIRSMEEGVYVDQLQLRRLKLKKLALKDSIARIKSSLIPDQSA